MKFYFDHNIVEYYLDKNDPLNIPVENLVAEINKGGYQLVYSPAHIEEIAVWEKRLKKHEVEIQKRLKNIGILTNNFEIRPFYKEGMRYGEFFAKFVYEEPATCYLRVVDDYSRNDWAEKYDDNSLRAAAERRAAKAEASDSNDVNNKKHEELLDHNFYDGSSINLSLEYSDIGFDVVQSFKDPVGYFKKDFRGMEGAIERAVKYLDEKGYYPDPIGSHRSRMHDISHLNYASYCDVFVTNDRKLFNKSKVIFNRFDLNVKSYLLKDIKNKIDNLSFM